MTSKVDSFFILYDGYVFSSTNAPGIALLQERTGLSLQRLQEEADYFKPLIAAISCSAASLLYISKLSSTYLYLYVYMDHYVQIHSRHSFTYFCAYFLRTHLYVFT